MPFDLTAAGPAVTRKTRRMPWAGRNEAILSRRAALPRLPRGWGSSFVNRLRYLGAITAPKLPDAAPVTDAG